jgi:predicted transcriptional regulator with HTH domain
MTAVVDGIVTTTTVDGINVPGTITGLVGNNDGEGKAVYGMVIVGIEIVGTGTTTLLGIVEGTWVAGIITTVVDRIIMIDTEEGTNVAGIKTGLEGNCDGEGIGRVNGAPVVIGGGIGAITDDGTIEGTLYVGTTTAVVLGIVKTLTVDGIKVPGTITGLDGKSDGEGKLV